MADFLEALHDLDLNVRRVALVAFNSAAHNKPSLIRDLLASTLPHLYSETKVRVRHHVKCTAILGGPCDQNSFPNISKPSKCFLIVTFNNDMKTAQKVVNNLICENIFPL